MSVADNINEAKQFGSTIVLIAKRGTSKAEREELHHEAAIAHDGPVFILPHNWQAIGLDELQAMIDVARGGVK